MDLIYFNVPTVDLKPPSKKTINLTERGGDGFVP